MIKSLFPQQFESRQVFYTELSVEQCLDRIVENAAHEGFAAFLDPRELMAAAAGSNFRLRLNHQGRNSWLVTFDGRLVPQGNGTRIEGLLSIFPWVEPFMSCLLIGIILVAIAFFALEAADVLRRSNLGADALSLAGQCLPICIGLPFMIVIARTIQISGRYSVPIETQKLVDWIEKLLEATRINEGGQ